MITIAMRRYDNMLIRVLILIIGGNSSPCPSNFVPRMGTPDFGTDLVTLLYRSSELLGRRDATNQIDLLISWLARKHYRKEKRQKEVSECMAVYRL